MSIHLLDLMPVKGKSDKPLTLASRSFPSQTHFSAEIALSFTVSSSIQLYKAIENAMRAACSDITACMESMESMEPHARAQVLSVPACAIHEEFMYLLCLFIIGLGLCSP
jgi:hypothetical protein